MVQIKLSIAFVLAAAAAINIAPVVAQPVGERGEFGGHHHHQGRGGEFGVGHRGRHEGHGGFHHGEGHDSFGGVPHPHHHHSLQEPTSEPNAASPSRREYEGNFKRDLRSELENIESALARNRPTGSLNNEPFTPPRINRPLLHRPTEGFMAREYAGFDDNFKRDLGSELENIFSNGVPNLKRPTGNLNNEPSTPPTINRPLLHRPTDGFMAREYAGSDDMIERDLENVGSGAKTVPRPRRRLFPPRRGPTSMINRLPRRRSGFGPNRGPPPTLGRPNLNFGPGPVVINEPAKPEVAAREYAEEMFERDFEDVEFDARDFNDELHLD